ncbi:HNH endonuclease [Ancylobacter sp. WKF20]|uniref:HNH endonuclease n=1 Tax=Ancylobacter sp. WKF20 TaxID=3039801 RepID=UPI002434345A|nr:HNH endonuclease [Ancylobacter sp. WKF20]WGD29589.1 HNH endonuclease [Ancylobacter sp. WKF20]
MPQVYVIASERGLEVGFAVSIAEEDYFDPETKERNRSIVPFINSKLPSSQDPVVITLDAQLADQGGWLFNRKTRLLPGSPGFDEFPSLSAMITFLKISGAATGGGAVARLFWPQDLSNVDLTAQLGLALDNFAPMLARCSPNAWDVEIRTAQTEVEALAASVEFDPASEEDGRRRVWAEVARRQGQATFRRQLLEAYDGACAISGTNVSDVLQAAHIQPYNGLSTNKVSNGLLLRADLHNLFDLKLISINPDSMKVVVSPRLRQTDYWSLDGCDLRLPTKLAWRPNSQALAAHFSEAVGET